MNDSNRSSQRPSANQRFSKPQVNKFMRSSSNLSSQDGGNNKNLSASQVDPSRRHSQESFPGQEMQQNNQLERVDSHASSVKGGRRKKRPLRDVFYEKNSRQESEDYGYESIEEINDVNQQNR